MKNKVILITILSIVFIAITEALIYLFFAFCCWDLNWPPNSCGVTRFLYAVCAVFGVFVNVGAAVCLIDDCVMKTE